MRDQFFFCVVEIFLRDNRSQISLNNSSIEFINFINNIQQQ